jgi:hypothetical protein
MIKRLFTTLVEFVCFCALFYIGGYWHWARLWIEMRAMERGVTNPPMIPLWRIHLNAVTDYQLNGLIFASVLLLIILLVQALRRRFPSGAVWTLGAFLLAFGLSLLLHSGFVPVTPAA